MWPSLNLLYVVWDEGITYKSLSHMFRRLLDFDASLCRHLLIMYEELYGK